MSSLSTIIRRDGPVNFYDEDDNGYSFAADERDEENDAFYGDDADDDLLEGPPPPLYYPGIDTCIVCQKRPPYSKNGKTYPTCGLTCASILARANTTAGATPPRPVASSSRQQLPLNRTQSRARHPGSPSIGRHSTADDLAQALNRLSIARDATRRPQTVRANTAPCVMCSVKQCYDGRFVTCGLDCAEKLANNGSPNPTMCNYCHRRPKTAGSDQCGQECIDKAKVACLLCKSRPKFKRYHLCGKSCKQIATKSTPRILEAPLGHATFQFVLNKFKDSWKFPTTPLPVIKKVYKIIESAEFLRPYDVYKKTIGNEVFRYHGTTRRCQLGTTTNQLCTSQTCALCCILRTSFKTSLANPTGAFGPGIYSSSAANKAYSYSSNGTGAVLLTKVILGNVRTVQGWNEVMSCPPGFNSVVFHRQNDTLNETIVYSDDAIRPVFLITF